MHSSRLVTRKRSSGETPVSLYVHIPFCSAKCPYCAFYSRKPKAGDLSKFLESLDREIAISVKEQGEIPKVRTAFIGGGTPTLLSPGYWAKLISLLERYFSFLPGAEITVEANPGSISPAHLDIWKEWRITRVSLGVQSLNDEDLRLLGRPHDSRQSLEAMSSIIKAGFSLSADLLFGLPFQNLRAWSRSLDGVSKNGAEHISIYQLMLEPGTPWGDAQPDSLSEGYPLYRWAQYFLEKKGFKQYEVASFAKSGRWCRHNVAYWQQRDVIGLGPSAWGYMGGERIKNTADLDKYASLLDQGKSPTCFSEHLKGRALESETAILAMRTRWGIRFDKYRKRFGEKALAAFLKRLDGIPPRLLKRNATSVALSKEGMRVGNSVWELFLP